MKLAASTYSNISLVPLSPCKAIKNEPTLKKKKKKKAWCACFLETSCEEILYPYIYAVMSVVPRHIFLCTKKFNSTHPWFNLFRIKYISLQAGSIVRMFGEKYFGSSASKQRGKVSKHMLWIFELCPFQGVKILSNRSKANEIKLTGSCICRRHAKGHQVSNPVRNKHQRHQFAWSGPLSFRQEAKVWFALYKLRNPP